MRSQTLGTHDNWWERIFLRVLSPWKNRGNARDCYNSQVFSSVLKRSQPFSYKAFPSVTRRSQQFPRLMRTHGNLKEHLRIVTFPCVPKRSLAFSHKAFSSLTRRSQGFQLLFGVIEYSIQDRKRSQEFSRVPTSVLNLSSKNIPHARCNTTRTHRLHENVYHMCWNTIYM